MNGIDKNSFANFATKLTSIEKALQNRDVVLDDQLQSVNRRSLRFRLLSLFRPFYIYFGYGDPFAHLKVENVARNLFTFLQEHKKEFVDKKILGEQVRGIWEKLDARTNRKFSTLLDPHQKMTVKFFPAAPKANLNTSTTIVEQISLPQPVNLEEPLSTFLLTHTLSYMEKRAFFIDLLTELTKRHEEEKPFGDISLSTICVKEGKIFFKEEATLVREEGKLLGTFGFLSPEMAAVRTKVYRKSLPIEEVDLFASDIWSLGVVFSAIVLGCSQDIELENQIVNNPAKKYEGTLSNLPFLSVTYRCVAPKGKSTAFLQDFQGVFQDGIDLVLDDLIAQMTKKKDLAGLLLAITGRMLTIDPMTRLSAKKCLETVLKNCPATAS